MQGGHQYDDLGYLAVRDAQAAAERASDPLRDATARTTLSWIFLRQGRVAEATQVALGAARAIQPRFARSTPDELVAYGGALWLALTGIARAGNREDADEVLGVLHAVAARLGSDRILPAGSWPSLGPGSVTVKAVSTAVELGDDGRALELAQQLRPDAGISPSPLTRARGLLDVAQAQCRAQRLDDALATMLETRRLAREWLRYQVLAREIARALWAKWPRGRRRPDGLRQLAEELNVLD